jgi:hypothetical protein
MYRSIKLILSSFLFFASFLLTPVSASDDPIEFTAHYKLHFNGAEVGDVSLSVKKVAANRYQLTSLTKSSGLAAIISGGDITETSLFERVDGQLRPITYHFNDNKKKVDLSFDWEQLRVTDASKNSSRGQTLKQGVLDKAVMLIALMQDLRTKGDKTTYQIADDGRIKSYAFKQQGQELLKLASGSYNTIKVVRQKEKKKELVYYWCAEELNMLPVVISRKKSFGTFKMVLASAEFTAQ